MQEQSRDLGRKRSHFLVLPRRILGSHYARSGDRFGRSGGTLARDLRKEVLMLAFLLGALTWRLCVQMDWRSRAAPR